MFERRRHRRWKARRGDKSTVILSGVREEVRLIDVSSRGMRAFFPRPVKKGTWVPGAVTILSGMGPVFIEGHVVRCRKGLGSWETAVKFETVKPYVFI